MNKNLIDDLSAQGMMIVSHFHRDDWLAYHEENKLSEQHHLPEGQSFLVVASTGTLFWQKFKASFYGASNSISYQGENPLDDWTKAIFSPIAQKYDAGYYHPSDTPYLPFQHYCLVYNEVIGKPIFHKSPLNILFHYHYGLWHGLRGLLAFKQEGMIDAVHPDVEQNQCENCETQPCIKACPSEAVQENGFIVKNCEKYIVSSDNKCYESCIARMACPYGVENLYPSEKSSYLMLRRRQNAGV